MEGLGQTGPPWRMGGDWEGWAKVLQNQGSVLVMLKFKVSVTPPSGYSIQNICILFFLMSVFLAL